MDKEMNRIANNLLEMVTARSKESMPHSPDSPLQETPGPPEEQERRRRTQARSRAEMAEVPPRFLEAMPDDFDPVTWRRCEAALREGSGLFLCGPAGTGKTHLAVAAMHALPRRRGERFITVPELLVGLRNSFRDGERVSEIDIIDRYASAPLLILDDLGAEKSTEFAIQSLYIIIDRRYAGMLRTIITSNLTLDEIAEKVGDRIASRIAGMCQVITMRGEDRRLHRPQASKGGPE